MARTKIDLRTGIQSISPPGVSKGGTGSVEFTASEQRYGQDQHLMLQKHMDMSAYTAGLQIVAGMIQATGTGTATLDIKQIDLWTDLPRT